MSYKYDIFVSYRRNPKRSGGSTIESAIEVLFTKPQDWAYEEEARFIKLGNSQFPDQGGTIAFNKTFPTTLTLGCKIPWPVCQAVRMILDNFQYKHTKLWRAHFDSSTQRLKYRELEFPKRS